jgi:hypothetical protein
MLLKGDTFYMQNRIKDRVPAELQQVFCKVIEADLTGMFCDFHKRELTLGSLNFLLFPYIQYAKRQRGFKKLDPVNLIFKQDFC